jgi:hypothetical protein
MRIRPVESRDWPEWRTTAQGFTVRVPADALEDARAAVSLADGGALG